MSSMTYTHKHTHIIYSCVFNEYGPYLEINLRSYPVIGVTREAGNAHSSGTRDTWPHILCKELFIVLGVHWLDFNISLMLSVK